MQQEDNKVNEICHVQNNHNVQYKQKGEYGFQGTGFGRAVIR